MSKFIDRSKFLVLDTTSSSDPEEVSKNLIDNIHQVFKTTVGWIIGVLLTVVYVAVFMSILLNKNKNHIQRRSPILMLMITVGVYFDSLLKLIILCTDY